MYERKWTNITLQFLILIQLHLHQQGKELSTHLIRISTPGSALTAQTATILPLVTDLL